MAGPCQREAAAKAGKVLRRRRLAGCRCNIDDTAVCFVDYCSMLTRVLCVLLFFCYRRDRSAKKVVDVLWALGVHTHIAQHAPRTHYRAPVASIDSLRMAAA